MQLDSTQYLFPTFLLFLPPIQRQTMPNWPEKPLDGNGARKGYNCQINHTYYRLCIPFVLVLHYTQPCGMWPQSTRFQILSLFKCFLKLIFKKTIYQKPCSPQKVLSINPSFNYIFYWSNNLPYWLQSQTE